MAAAALTGVLAAPAVASSHPNGMGNDAWRAPCVPTGRGPRSRPRAASRRHGYHGGYRGGHEGYYGAPPIVYAPQGYYQQPGVSLNFGLPIY